MNVQAAVERGRRDWAFVLGVQVYVWGSPLLACWRDRLRKLRAADALDSDPAVVARGLNRFRHVRTLSSPTSSEFVNAATDFLYSTAVVDLSDGPLLLRTPAVSDRWHGVQILDAYMETLANLGTRENGAAPGVAILARKGAEPAAESRGDARLVLADSDHLYLVGRIEAEPGRLASAQAIQDALSLTPLSAAAPARSRLGRAPAATAGLLSEAESADDDPLTFFRQIGAILPWLPPRPDERMMFGLLRDLGFDPETGFSAERAGPAVCAGLRDAVGHARELLERKLFEVGRTVNGWSLVKDIGRYGHDYIVRALVAKHGIWANVPEESLYFMAWTDGRGEILHGDKRYRIAFPAAAPPPVSAFWSISYYDQDGKIVDSPAGRYSLHSRYGGLRADGDGMIRLAIERECPPDVPESNWLPSHDGVFNLNFRCYQPDRALLDMSYPMPAIDCLDR